MTAPWWLRFVRWPNLVIVALTQCLLQYLVMLPLLEQAGLSPLLDPIHFALLVLDTLLIAMGGYIINDLLDHRADLVNKPDKVFVGRHVSPTQGRYLYAGLNVLGFLIAGYLAIHVNNLGLLSIYPLAVWLLYLYSRYWKRLPLIGNLVVAAFCAFVAGVVWFAERESFADIAAQQPVLASRSAFLFGGYLLFAFLTTMYREIVKDLEDLEGDRAEGLRTLPVVAGTLAAKIWAAAFLLPTLLALGFWMSMLWEGQQRASLAFTLAAIVVPLLASGIFLVKARTKADYARLSRLVKWVMLAGLLLLVMAR